MGSSRREKWEGRGCARGGRVGRYSTHLTVATHYYLTTSTQTLSWSALSCSVDSLSIVLSFSFVVVAIIVVVVVVVFNKSYHTLLVVRINVYYSNIIIQLKIVHR